MKKALIIILSIILLGSLVTISYFIWDQRTATPGDRQDKIFNLFPVGDSVSDTGNHLGEGGNVNLSNQTTFSDNPTENLNLKQLKISGLKTAQVGQSTRTFFIERSTGHLYSLDEQNNLNRLTNLTWPGANQIYWGQNGDIWQIIFQKADGLKLESSLGRLEMDLEEDLLEIKTIPWFINQTALAVSPKADRFVYLTPGKDGSSVVYLNNWTLTKPVEIWSSLLSDWNLDWSQEEVVMISARPTYDYPGSIYFLNPSTKQTKKVIDNINGLTANLAPDGEKLIYSKSLLSGFSLYQYEVKTKNSRLLDLKTLPEKCTWGREGLLYCAVPKIIPTGNYPDDWYQGKVVFSDNLWLIDLEQGITRQLHQLKGDYDLTNLTINETNGWLYAINKKDQTLQTFSLNP